MGKKAAKYVVLNKNSGGEFHEVVANGDDAELLKKQYMGSAYEILKNVPLNEREEW